MKNRVYSLALVLFSVILTNCKENNPGPVTSQSQTELLVAHTWKISQISDVNGRGYTDSQLSVNTLAVKFLDFQFRNDNTVRASDSDTKQILNGGTWTLADNNTAIDVDVTGFKGKFPVITLTRNKLVLRQTDRINGVPNTPINLEFVPSL